MDVTIIRVAVLASWVDCISRRAVAHTLMKAPRDHWLVHDIESQLHSSTTCALSRRSLVLNASASDCPALKMRRP